MPIELPALPYGEDALEPHISARTIAYHYGKHHKTYVENLNRLIEGTDFEQDFLEEIMCKSEGSVFNNAAQVWNHSFYWECLSPSGGGEPKGKLAEAIHAAFGDFDAFRKQFSQTALTTFGSGWAWLVRDKQGRLALRSTIGAANPLLNGETPLLTCDVWEHAYYLDHQNARPAYLEAFWNLVNWEFVEANLEGSVRHAEACAD